jgi:transcriptional regulator with XRE-family HTH domain
MADTNPQHARVIGEKLRAVRQNRQMSLRELANKAEVSASMLSQIETGKVFPSVRSLYSIANALDVSVDYFFPEQSGERVAVAPNAGEATSQHALTASEMRDAKLNGGTQADKDFTTENPSSTPVVHMSARPLIELKGE